MLLAGFVLAVGVAVLAPRAAAAEGKAEGKLTVNGKTTDVKYAYAWAGPGFFDKTKEDVTVIVSDVPLDAKALEDEFERIHMADAGKLHAFEITFGADAQAHLHVLPSQRIHEGEPERPVQRGRLREEDVRREDRGGALQERETARVLRLDVRVRRGVQGRHHPQGEARAAVRGGDGGRPEEPAGEGVRGLPQGHPERGPRGDAASS